jgi:hypothetical protein
VCNPGIDGLQQGRSPQQGLVEWLLSCAAAMLSSGTAAVARRRLAAIGAGDWDPQASGAILLTILLWCLEDVSWYNYDRPL